MEKIFLNGEILEDYKFIRAISYGEGVFETFRYKNKLPKTIKEHYERLIEGANFIKIPKITYEDYIYYIEEAIKKVENKDLYVKTLLFGEGSAYYPLQSYKSNLLIIIRDFQPVEKPYRLTVAPFRVHSLDPLLKIKSANYLRNIYGKRYANENGYDDVIILNENDEITETTSANIFWIKGKYLYTPSLDCGVLNGIARRVIIEEGKKQGFVVVEGRFNLKDLKQADKIFLTNALHWIIKVSEVKGV
ncbi:aminotransferase class IV [Venenivibrio stagnispumantis]|uniref:4-amino-4-deoxychorismate lyase n=1 Tax=Venenivibrio stagnispumantis TaxID=407998 RepID=A0AA46AEP3_9AQUI|nr:aminotransferase class IV [Venenivibrio stagnispumantis]MCW4572783.1 aminotransferase class IV [Venenivibrio stagnispumantis]SMP13865.1 4-amino-4-deoxychorismate lyase [Venenivibrio stagnispumantis]